MQLTGLKVTKSNALIHAGYKLSLHEQRLILASIGQLDGRKPAPARREFRIYAGDYARTFDVDQRDAYSAIKEAANTLYERDIRTYDGKHRERFRWVQRVRYVEGEGCVVLWFSEAVLPYLTQLQSQFTEFSLGDIAQLRSTYAIRLYEMLMEFKDVGQMHLELASFRERLELSDQYDRFDNLRARVIEPAVKELRAKANMQLTWRAVRAKRRIVALDFRFGPKKQLAFTI